MIKLNTYKLKLKFDNGIFTIKTYAINKTQAIRQVLAFENCPFNAIKKIERI